MKFKAFLSLLLVLTLLVPSASAESIFPKLEKPEEKAPVVAPSYCMIEGKEPDDTGTNANGDTIVTFKNVDENGFNNFGRYLGEMRYSVVGQETKDGMYAFALSNGQTEFSMVYDQSSYTLSLVYPADVEYEHPLLPGYKRIWLGDTLKINGLGEITILSYDHVKSADENPLLRFMYYNTDKNGKLHGSYEHYSYGDYLRERSDLINENKYIYINNTNIYKYSSSLWGYIDEKGEFNKRYRHIDSLDTEILAISFLSVPDVALQSTDGALVITLKFKGSEDNYYLLLRKEGINLY